MHRPMSSIVSSPTLRFQEQYIAASRHLPSPRLRVIRASETGIQARSGALAHALGLVSATFTLVNPRHNALAFLISSSLPVAMVTNKGH